MFKKTLAISVVLSLVTPSLGDAGIGIGNPNVHVDAPPPVVRRLAHADRPSPTALSRARAIPETCPVPLALRPWLHDWASGWAGLVPGCQDEDQE